MMTQEQVERLLLDWTASSKNASLSNSERSKHIVVVDVLRHVLEMRPQYEDAYPERNTD